MKKPTIQEVAEYIQEKGYSVDAESFWHHYEGIGWKVGKNPMQKWKSTVVTWHRKAATTQTKPATHLSMEERARRLGISANPGESWDDLGRRVEIAEQRSRH